MKFQSLTETLVVVIPNLYEHFHRGGKNIYSGVRILPHQLLTLGPGAWLLNL